MQRDSDRFFFMRSISIVAGGVEICSYDSMVSCQ